MSGRIGLYINAARNDLLRDVVPSIAYSASQIAVCVTIREFFVAVPSNTIIDAAAYCGNVDRETTFRPNIAGDKNKNGEYEAHGICQWHDARRENIYKFTGIDVLTADINDQLKAWLWEISDTKSWYGHILDSVQRQPTLLGKNTVLIRDYEQSGNQPKDIARQMMLSTYWLNQWRITNIP